MSIVVKNHGVIIQKYTYTSNYIYVTQCLTLVKYSAIDIDIDIDIEIQGYKVLKSHMT